MKNLKKILSAVLILTGLTVFAQEEVAQKDDNARMEQINAIAANAIINSDGPKLGADENETKKNLSLYSEYYKQKAYADALPFWRKVYFSAPKASKNMHIHGVKMYKSFAKAAEGDLKEAYIDTALAIHETRMTCFGPSAKSNISRTYDWYYLRKKGNEALVLEMFDSTYALYIKEGKANSFPASYLIPWNDIALRAYKTAKVIEIDVLLENFETVSDIAEFNISAGNDAGKYKGAIDKITEKLNKYEILTCENLIPIAEKKYRSNPDDTATIEKAYKALKAGSCTSTPLFIEIADKMATIKPNAALFKFLSVKAKKDGNKTKAISYLKQSVNYTESASEKAELYNSIANLYYSLGNYGSTREYANKALALRPNWGTPYITIGRTYASSGKACSGGVGTGFEAQVVTWVAIDTWNKAKSVDASVAAEAQKLISRYWAYMPTKTDLFMQGITLGSSYTVSCLGKTTTVRASDQ